VAVAAAPMSSAPSTTSISQTAIAPRLSIVVLPFANLSSDPAQGYLSPNQPADKQANEAADQDANQNKSKCMLLRPRDAVFFQDVC
jgi:hypothetical protein